MSELLAGGRGQPTRTVGQALVAQVAGCEARVVVTGASCGVGLELSRQLLRASDRSFGTLDVEHLNDQNKGSVKSRGTKEVLGKQGTCGASPLKLQEKGGGGGAHFETWSWA